MTTNYFYKNTKSKFLEISGQDSVPFIQNLITNDINKCKENHFVYSCLLTPQGKFFADFFIFKNKEKYFFEVNDIFYQAEETYDEYTYSRLLINADQSRSAEERDQSLIELQQMLPEDVRQSMKKSQIIDELNIKTARILSEGGNQQQVRQLRKDMFGEDAAQRFDALDLKRAQWQARIDDYLNQRLEIMNTKGLPQEEIQLQVNALRDVYFDPREQLKLVVYERRADA